MASVFIQTGFGKDKAPCIDLIPNEDCQGIDLASEYLQGSEIYTLDDYFKKNDGTILEKKSHIRIITDPDADKTKGQISVDHPLLQPLKKAGLKQLSFLFLWVTMISILET